MIIKMDMIFFDGWIFALTITILDMNFFDGWKFFTDHKNGCELILWMGICLNHNKNGYEFI
jgi:hypothetical protein